MTRLIAGPHRPVQSLVELFAIAAGVAVQATAAYSGLAARMRQSGRAKLADVFEGLAAGTQQLFDAAADNYHRLAGKAAEISALAARVPALFDDEGAAGAAPELASAYGAFAMAVRNAERAFAFWTYVAAHAPARDVRQAAEEMARDGLARIAALRRDRRRAFHAERVAPSAEEPPWTIEVIERKLVSLFEAEARQATSPAAAGRLERLAASARERADALHDAPLGPPQHLRNIRPEAAASGRVMAELLLDCYLDIAEETPTEAERVRAQRYAGELLNGLAPLESS